MSFMNRQARSVDHFPFGLSGPTLRIQTRHRDPARMLGHGIWCFMCFVALVLMGPDCYLYATGWTWIVHGLVSVILLALQMARQASLEAWAAFWLLPMAHGLHWALAVQVCARGTYQLAVFDRMEGIAEEDITSDTLFPLSFFALFLPPLATLAYAVRDHHFLAVSFYDLHSDLLPEHRWPVYLCLLCSPALPLAVWHYFLNPRAYTDLPTPWVPLFGATAATANAIFLRFFCYSELNALFGEVKWYGDQWVVWLMPVPQRMSSWI